MPFPAASPFRDRRSLRLLAALLAAALGSAFALPAAGLPTIPVFVDTFLDFDLDGDGFRDQPLPPLGTPSLFDFADPNGLSVAELVTTADNGLVIATVVDLDPGDPDPTVTSLPFFTGRTDVDGSIDGVTVPVFGYAAGRSEIVARIPLALTPDGGGFSSGSVDLEVSGRVSGRMTYFFPRLAGVQLGTSYVLQSPDDFGATQMLSRSGGTPSGNPDFVANVQIAIDPVTSDEVWTFQNIPFTLAASAAVPTGGPFAEVIVEVKQFVEFQAENFFGSAPIVVDSDLRFELTGTGFEIVSIRSTTPGVATALSAPEPGLGAGLVAGALGLVELARRRRLPAARPRREKSTMVRARRQSIHGDVR